MNVPARKKNPRRRQVSAGQDNQPRKMCYRCMRPSTICHCAVIPRICTRTQVIIAQHIGERSHPFNTARMVHQALPNSQLLTDYPQNIHRFSDRITCDTALLYPSRSAVELDCIPPGQKPKQLLILDGTWNHAKLLYRNWPQLRGLKHYKITPQAPGNYRIRLEPNDCSLSTVEATVQALRYLEPDLMGLDDLIAAFQIMVERQLAHPAADYSNASSRKRPTRNIPRAIFDKNAKLVFAYGETEPLLKGSPKKIQRSPVYWVAQREDTGERFHAAIESDAQMTPEILNHFGLQSSAFNHPISSIQFQWLWNEFIRPDDILIVYNHNTIRLLRPLGALAPNPIAIRSINFSPQNRQLSLSQYFAKNQIAVQPAEFPGRAGRRLANLITLIRHLREKPPLD